MRSIKNTCKGIGLRTEHVNELVSSPKLEGIDFLEICPENWMNIGGSKSVDLQNIAEKYPLIAHGLSLSIADALPLNTAFIQQIKLFLDEYGIQVYSDHLSFSRDTSGYLYDLLPVPRYTEILDYLCSRIQQVQEMLKRPLILENISYYHAYPDQLPEQAFIKEIIKKTGCGLLLDINNVYVNSTNHHFNPYDFIKDLPSQAIAYYHIAGHFVQPDGLVIDTHGKTVTAEVIALAKYTFERHGVRPLLLERDNHVPPIDTLCQELASICQQLVSTELLED